MFPAESFLLTNSKASSFLIAEKNYIFYWHHIVFFLSSAFEHSPYFYSVATQKSAQDTGTHVPLWYVDYGHGVLQVDHRIDLLSVAVSHYGQLHIRGWV